MSRQEYNLHSILIVSGSGPFTETVRRAIPSSAYVTVDVKQNASSARRAVMERSYDIVIINIPLPDETGVEFSLDIAESINASILMAAPGEVYEYALEYVTDQGIMVLSKPFEGSRLNQSLRYLMAVQEKLRKVEKQVQVLEEKAQEQRIVTKAKFYLVEEKHFTEDEAHRYIGKLAMDNGVSRKRAAQKILEDI